MIRNLQQQFVKKKIKHKISRKLKNIKKFIVKRINEFKKKSRKTDGQTGNNKS